jgi:transketolase
LNVKMVASHGGISVGEDGASQMSIEDIALMATLPGVAVINPADELSGRALIRATAAHNGPVYVRTGRPKVPVVYTAPRKFEIGKGVLVREGKDVTIVANGLLVAEAVDAAEILATQGIQAGVIDMHTVKPLDHALLLQEAKKTGKIVVAEEHSIWGGLCAAVSTYLSSVHPCKMSYVAIQDTYAETATPDELLDKYGMRAVDVVNAAKKLFS